MQAKGILSHVKDLVCHHQNCFLVPLVSVLATDWEMSHVFISCASSSSDIVQPYSNIRKKRHCWYYICTGHSHILASHLTAGHAAWERGCEHFLPNKQPSRVSPRLLPFSSLRCNRPLQQTLWPQGYTISVHHSQEYSSHFDSAHKYPTSFANHFSSSRSSGKQEVGFKKAVKSLSETPLHKIFLGFSLLSSHASPFSCAVFKATRLMWVLHRVSEMLRKSFPQKQTAYIKTSREL